MQTAKRSLFEVCCNIGTGAILAVMTWRFIVVPQTIWFGWELKSLATWQQFYITFWFTIISMARSYFWRRLFNRGD